MTFRTDINALRGIAVLAVVLYHFNISWMPGGFSGVDVFFVISGYLMTGIILSRLADDQFSLRGFYLSRLHRILPALVVLCAILLGLGYFYLSPGGLDELASQTKHAILFYSNIRYADDVGYFAHTAKEIWLLHTWSLAVEFQFYLLLPLALLLCHRLGGMKAVAGFVILGILASFGVAIYYGSRPELGGYYLLQTRAWELLAGSAVYLAASRLGAPPYARQLSWIGYGLIAVSAVGISFHAVWPGPWTLLPVAGTCLVLLTHRESALTRFAPLQWMGRISYSVYLWHWPVSVMLFKMGYGGWWLILGIFVSIGLGAISYYTAERIRMPSGPKSFSNIAYGSVILLLVAVSHIRDQEGLPNRPVFSDEQQAMYRDMERGPEWDTCLSSAKDPISVDDACQYVDGDQTTTWAVIGDSHSLELSRSLSRALGEAPDGGVVHYGYSGCTPSYGESSDFSDCSAWASEVMKTVLANDDIKNVVLAYRYGQHLFGKNEDVYPRLPDDVSPARRQAILSSLHRMASALRNAGRTVHIMGPVPEIARTTATILDVRMITGGDIDHAPAISLDYYLRRNDRILDFLQTMDADGFDWVRIRDIFCDDVNCYATAHGHTLYQDDDHPSPYATDIIAQRIVEGSSRSLSST